MILISLIYIHCLFITCLHPLHTNTHLLLVTPIHSILVHILHLSNPIIYLIILILYLFIVYLNLFILLTTCILKPFTPQIYHLHMTIPIHSLNKPFLPSHLHNTHLYKLILTTSSPQQTLPINIQITLLTHHNHSLPCLHLIHITSNS